MKITVIFTDCAEKRRINSIKKDQARRRCVLKDSFTISQQKDKRLQPEAPSGRELAPQATEGEYVTIKLAKR